MSTTFNYDLAFSRNIGWVTRSEQQQLRNKKVAIAGMGGVGGIHLLTLARLGVSHFHIADFDEFELQNFNRQVGANMQTINASKVETLRKMVLDINPEASITCFNEAITPHNVEAFLDGIDLYIDSIDFFVLDARELLFNTCEKKGIPSLTAGPIGMGTVYLIFMPGKMSFKDYFAFEGLSDLDKQINFLIGVAPKAYHRSYLVDPTSINLVEKRGPSTMMACNLCAGVAGTLALKILLNRGPVYAAPYYHYFDAYNEKYYRGYLRNGNKNWLQRLKRMLFKKVIAKQLAQPPASFSIFSAEGDQQAPIYKILDLARWAPSGNNHQPWRFKIKDDTHFTCQLIDESDSNKYDFNSIPTLVSGGALLENIILAATQHHYRVEWQYQKVGIHEHQINITLIPDANIQQNELAAFIPLRSVDRTAYRHTNLTSHQKELLAAALGDQFTVQWHSSWRERLHMSYVNFLTTDIRLKMPELMPIHQEIIDLKNQYSKTGIPIDAVGLSPFTKRLFSKLILHPRMMNFMSQYLGSTYSSGLEMDILPGLASAAHFTIHYHGDKNVAFTPNVQIELGRALQRFWLRATQLGLVIQPTYASVMISYYVNHKQSLSSMQSLDKKAQKIADKMNAMSKNSVVVFKGRIGAPRTPHTTSRSIRRDLKDLLL